MPNNSDKDKPKRGGSFKPIATRQGTSLGTGTFSSLSSVSSTKRLEGAIILPLSDLVPNFFQVRQHFDEEALAELAEDIKERGILEPLIVREAEAGNFEIIAGERRYRAAQAAGLNEVPVIVRQMDDRQARFATLAENLQRQDLEPKDEQRFFQLLQADYNLSIREIAKLISKSKGYVQNRLEGNLQEMQPAAKEEEEQEEEKCTSEVQLSDNSQSSTEVTPKKSSHLARYNPAVYKRVSQFFDNTLQILDSKPDKQTVERIRESVVDTEQKLSELKKKLAEAEMTE